MESEGGAALFIDYGQAHGHTLSLRAIRHHAFVPVLAAPGSADLSCMVDFRALASSAASVSGRVHVAGPVTQGALLTRLGADERLMVLLQGAREEAQAEAQTRAHQRLTSEDPEHMGGVYKALAVLPAALKGEGVPGFDLDPRLE